jgi:predicted transcriptional regulator
MFGEILNNNAKKILELETRRKIYQIVKNNSGCHFREIERRSGITYGTLKYHLNFLAKHGLILCRKDENSLRYFPADFRNEDLKLLGILRQTVERKVILFLVSNKSANQKEISDFVGLSPSTTSWHLGKLVKSEILKHEKVGARAYYSLKVDKNEIIKLLISYRNSFLDSLVDKTIEMWEI